MRPTFRSGDLQSPGKRPHTRRTAEGIEVPDADVKAKLPWRRSLEHPPRVARGFAAGRHQPLLHGHAQFGGVAVTLVLEHSGTLCPHPLRAPVGCAPTDHEPGGRCRLPPRLPSQHTCNQLGFGSLPLYWIHRCLLGDVLPRGYTSCSSLSSSVALTSGLNSWSWEASAARVPLSARIHGRGGDRSPVHVRPLLGA